MSGMYSSRRYSFKKHIDNLHDGIGNIRSFNDYIAGRGQEVYFPNPISNYLLKQTQLGALKNRPLDIMRDELFRTALRKSFRHP